MLTRSPRMSAIAFAAAFALSSLLLTLFVWMKIGGGVPFSPNGYRIHMRFAQAQNLLPNEDVRIAGVNIGKVVSVTPTTGLTDAVVEIDLKYAPLAADARAILRTKTLLGETFIELTPGTRAAPKIPDGGTLADSHVAPTVQLDQFLNTFDASTRRALLDWLTGTATALHSRDTDLNNAIGSFDPTIGDLDTLMRTLDGQRPDLQGLIHNSAIVLHSLGDEPSALRGFVVNGARTLAALDDSRRNLAATVDAFGPFQFQLASTAHEAALAAQDAAPTVRTLEPAASDTEPAIAGADQLAQVVRGLFRASNPALRDTEQDLPALQRMLRVSPPLFSRLYPAAQQLVPFIDLIGAYRREIVAALADFGASAEASAATASGVNRHYIRGIDVINNEYYVAYDYRFGSNRHNAYPAPGEIDNLAHGGLGASNCSNENNANYVAPITAPGNTGSAVPPCLTQKPWFFEGATRYYPHLTSAR